MNTATLAEVKLVLSAELDTGLEDDRVWMTYTCGARINLSLDMAHTGGSLGSDVQG